MAKGNQDEATKPMIDGGNYTQTIRETASIMEEMDELENQRKVINKNLDLLRGKLEAQGVNKHANKAARAYGKLDTKQRADFDLSYDVSRKAIGLPVQEDLFAQQQAQQQAAD